MARPSDVQWTRTITIGGLPGTGTTTACATLEKLSGLKYIYAGALFRHRAAEMGMTLEQFGAYAEQHPEEDRSLDAKQAEWLRQGPLLLEGRMSGFLAFRDRIPAYKVWFTCDPYIRARRIVGREGGEAEARMEEMRRREESERKRYIAFYGYDPSDLSIYDLVLDTSELSKEGVVDAVVNGYAKAAKRRWWRPFARV